MLLRTAAFVFLALLPLHAAQDLDEVMAKADKILEQAKEGYESGKSKASPELLTAAAFKLEEARLKYLAVQELAKGDQLQLAIDRLKEVNQLAKLLHEAKLTLSGKKPDEPAPKPVPAEPATPVPVEPPLKVAPPPKPLQLPLPDAAQLRDTEKAIKDLFKAEYAKKAQADVQTLARKLLQQGVDSADDPTARFVFLREARDLALQCGDLETALSSISMTGQWFQFDAVAAKTAALTKAATSLRGAEGAQMLAKAWLQIVEEAIAASQFDAAAAAAVKADASAKATNDPMMISKVQAISKDAAFLQKESNALKAVRKTLEEKPDDPAANFAMGRFLCIAVGDWDQGLPMLAKGSDADLKALATRDLAQPAGVADQIGVGDGWWSLSEKEANATLKRRLKTRAMTWYKIALPAADGLVKAKLEVRLRESGAIPRAGKPTKSDRIGGAGGGEFEDVARTETAILIGLKYTVVPYGASSIVKSIAPIFSDGLTRTEGKMYGEPSGTVMEVIAKPGYAVGSVVGKGGTRLDGMKIVFMKNLGPALDPRDSYSSKWLGGMGGGPEQKLGGDGTIVIGIQGKCGVDIDCFGLVQLK